MTKPDALAPIAGLEATVTGGRTVQAKKRGGKHEARERFIEEATGAIVWLFGVKLLNHLGDKILEKMFGGNFDVGTDEVLRTPFDNFIKDKPQKIKPKNMAWIKASKVLLAVLIADAFIGLVVPPLNQKLTRTLAKKQQAELANENSNDKIENSSDKDNAVSPSFKGGGSLAAINVFTNAIENTNTGKLLSTDVGLTSGRIYSARNKEERREIAIRDIGSIYFYMWAQKHVGNLLNFVESGRFNRLNPSSTSILDLYLKDFIKSNGGELSVEEFRKLALGNKSSEIVLPENIPFKTGKIGKFTQFMDKFKKVKTEPLQVAKVSDLKGKFDDITYERIKEMSKLQPLKQGEAVVTKQQIIDAVNIAEINNPKMLDNVFREYTGGKFDPAKRTTKGGASANPYKYVSNNKLYKLKSQMEDYINDICKQAKDGKVTQDLLNSIKKKNLAWNGVNFLAGFVTAAVFLSTLIPKFQYWYTRVTTGKNSFPGTYDLEQELKTEA